jgi:hypothetical protein
MHKFIFGVLLLPALAHAQPVTVEKPVICDTPKTVIETLTGEGYQEQPFWIGNDETSRYILLANEKTKSWTIVQFNKNIACILGTGDNHKQVFSKPAV